MSESDDEWMEMMKWVCKIIEERTSLFLMALQRERGKGLWPARLTQSTFPFSDFLESPVELHKLCRCIFLLRKNLTLYKCTIQAHFYTTHTRQVNKSREDKLDILRLVQREIKRTHTTHITTHFDCIAGRKGFKWEIANESLIIVDELLLLFTHLFLYIHTFSHCHCTRNNGFFTLLCNMYLLTNTRAEKIFFWCHVCALCTRREKEMGKCSLVQHFH